MTEAVYLEDSSVRRFDATVDRVHADGRSARVVLDRTHFYPTGGGQPHDTGSLRAGNASWTVTDVTGRDAIYHEISGPDAPEAGTTVTAELDWGRRFAHMRYHTAQHLLSAVLLDEFGARTVGNQLYADRARIDCERDRFSPEDLAEIERHVNGYVDDGRRVRWYELDRGTAERRLDPTRTRLSLLPDSITTVRIVEIEGVDRTACAGTHVSSTDAIGRFSIAGRETGGSGRERLHFVLRDGSST